MIDEDFLAERLLDGSAVVLDVEAKEYYCLTPAEAAVWERTLDRRAFLAGLVAVQMATEIAGSLCDRIPPEKRPPKCFQ